LHQNASGAELCPDTLGEAYSAPPDSLAGFLRVGIGKGDEGKGGGERTERKGREGKRERKEEGEDHSQ